jgi:hypothetical protein
MSLREELDRLAEECDLCSLSDDGSLDEHLVTCPSCHDHLKKAEEVSQMIQTMKMLAAKPEEDRHKILSARIHGFTQMPDEKRYDAITDMLDALHELPQEDVNTVVRTRLDILTGLPRDERMKLLGSMKDIMQNWSMDRKMIEQQAVMTATDDYMMLKRMMVRRMFKKLMS